MAGLTLGALARSRKPDERRLPIHPRHVGRIDPELRRRIRLEHGYGEPFGVGDDELGRLVAGLASRDELVAESDILLLPKPLAADLAEMPEGRVLWGWPHCVQDRELTQIAIDRRLTLVAWEAMNRWKRNGAFGLHVFHRNNELAGYASVLHAMELIGTTGTFGRSLTAAVIGFGATGRGAVTALHAMGIAEVTVLTQRAPSGVAAQIEPMTVIQFDVDAVGAICARRPQGDDVSVVRLLAEFDIVVNCVLQNPEEPLVFVTEADLPALRPGTLVVDVSCDAGMGFSWARPTSFADPMFTVGDHVRYYGVDHSPSHLWDSATWEVSNALLPYLPTMLAGPAAWDADETVRRGIEIRDGVVQNRQILSFQGRADEYPHPLTG